MDIAEKKITLKLLTRPSNIPFYFMHVACLAVFFVPFSWKYVGLAVALYYLRMFGITAGYHRYFAHKSYKTSRIFQFVLALLGTLAQQKGVLWWAGHHRDHHKYSGSEEDLHAPEATGFLWSHLGWILHAGYDETPYHRIKDMAKYPEIKWLNENWLLPPVLMAVLLAAIGLPYLVWGYFVSTVLLYHGTFVINSLCHMFGRRRFETKDDSRNSLILALLTLGEGWHNNHHHYQSAARQGMYWWEIDISFWVLRVLSWFRIVWDLKPYPLAVYARAKKPQLSVAKPLAKIAQA